MKNLLRHIFISIFFLFSFSGIKAQTFFQTQSDSLFQTDFIGEIHFNFTSQDWAFLINDPERQEYVKAQISVFGKTLPDSVGVRFKGSYGTLWSCVDENDSITCPKLSMKVDVNFQEKKQRLFGIKKFGLHSMVNDGSKMREKLAYDLYRKEGIPAPRTSWVKVFINGKAYGIYALIEQIDNKFVDYHWPQQDQGVLYKEAYPNNIDTNYYFVQQKTKRDSLTADRFIQFSNEAYNANFKQALDSFIDMSMWVKYVALETMINNWDGITTFYCSPIGACKPHNFYMYLYEKMFTPILWDTDLSFSVRSLWTNLPEWYEEPQSCRIIEYPGGAYLRPAQCDGLFRFTKHFYFEAYLDTLKALNQRYLENGLLHKEVEKWQSHLKSEISKEMPEAAWQNEVENLKATLKVIEEQTHQEINGGKWQDLTFNIAQGITFNDIPEHQLKALLRLRTSKNAYLNISKTNENIAINFMVDTSNKTVSNTWGDVSFPFNEFTDLSIFKSFVIEIEDGNPGEMWQLAISSSNYTQPNTPEFFTADLRIEKNKTKYELPLTAFTMRKWAGVNDLDDLNEVLKGVDGLVLKPIFLPKSQNSLKISIKSIYLKK